MPPPRAAPSHGGATPAASIAAPVYAAAHAQQAAAPSAAWADSGPAEGADHHGAGAGHDGAMRAAPLPGLPPPAAPAPRVPAPSLPPAPPPPAARSLPRDALRLAPPEVVPVSVGSASGVGATPRAAPLPAARNAPAWGSPAAKAALCALVNIDARYTPLKQIGTGAYGVVVAARDELTGERVAVKKVSNAFSNAVDARRTLREMALMRHLRHDNVAPLRDVLTTGDDVYLVYELMDTDLHRICRSPQALSDEHISFFLYQALRGLKYVHSAGVMHRDLKPSNLLVNANCDLKLCDFGLARACVAPEASSARALRLTEYVVTRWYRAPELLLSCPSYSQSVDVWSAGCILAELLGRRPLFPGRDYIQQLNLQLRVLGTPREEDLAHVTNVHARRYVRSMPDMPPVALQALFPKSNPLALDLLAKMLVFVPSKRLTVKQALEHPYLAKLHDVMDEPTYANTAVAEAAPAATAAGGRAPHSPVTPGDGSSCAGGSGSEGSGGSGWRWPWWGTEQELCSGGTVIMLECDSAVPTVEDVRDRVIQEMLRHHPEFQEALAEIARAAAPPPRAARHGVAASTRVQAPPTPGVPAERSHLQAAQQQHGQLSQQHTARALARGGEGARRSGTPMAF